MELVVRTSASPYPEIESKWVQFNYRVRVMGGILEDHVSSHYIFQPPFLN
jgi:hypothetical protein